MFPPGIDTVVVDVGRYTSQAGSNAYTGTITFTPATRRLHIASGTLLFEDPIQLDVSSGELRVTLVASDARGFDAADVQYTVAFNITGPGGPVTINQKSIYLTRLAPLVDLELLSPVAGATPAGVSLPYVLSVAGLSGAVSDSELASRLIPLLPSGGGGGGGGGAPVGGWRFTDLDSNVQNLLGLAQDALRLGGDIGGTTAAPQIKAGVVGVNELSPSLSLPKGLLASDVQASLALAETALQPGDVGGPGGDVPPATSTVLGTIKLTGDLGGTANSPTVPALASKVDTGDSRLTNARTPLDHDHAGEDIASGTVAANRLGSGAATGRALIATSATTATWQTFTTGGGGDGLVATLALSGAGPHIYDDDAWNGKVVEVDSSVPATVQLPVGQSPGTFAHIVQTGTGTVTVAAGSGASLQIPTGATAACRARYSQITARRRVDPSGGSFPTSGLLARFQGTSLPAAGSAVSSWADTSGVGSQSLVQATTASQPVVATVSGYKAARFNGNATAGSWMQMTGTLLNLARNRSTLVFYAVCVYGSAVAGKRTLTSLSTGTSTTAGRAFLQKETDSTLVAGGRRFDADSASQSARGGDIPVGVPFLLLGRLQYAANAATVYLNGTAPTTAGFTNPNTAWLTGSTASTSDTASLAGAVGANTNGSAEFWLGDILDMGFYSSDVDRAALGTALQNQYGGIFAASDYLGAGNRWILSGELG